MKRFAVVLVGLSLAIGCGDDDGGTDAGTDTSVDVPRTDTNTDTGECVMGDEDTPAACDDGCDNDGDMFIDCEDFGCDGVGACGVMMCEVTEPEDTAEKCADGCDNDGNGFADCNDFACSAFCPSEASNAACSDGIDNDDNGFTDCMDFSCRGMDGTTGFAACIFEDSNANCSDGMDNDGDGDIDCDDEDCDREHVVVCNGTTSVDVPPAMWPSLVEERCSDGINNEASEDPAFIDCGDFDCQNTLLTTICHDLPEERGNTNCSDGEDNDADGLTDCEDDDCDDEGIVVCASGVAVPLTPAEITAAANARCMGGADEDMDGRADCMDFSCDQDSLITVCGGENNDEECMDGIDNDDTDTFIDCADFSCSRNPDVTVCDVEGTVATCSDGMDNDDNGFVDCDDFGCTRTAACRGRFE